MLSNRTFYDSGNVLYLCSCFNPRNLCLLTPNNSLLHYNLPFLLGCVFPHISIHLAKGAGKARGNSHTGGDIGESREQ